MFCFCQSATIHDRFATCLVGDLHHVTKLGKATFCFQEMPSSTDLQSYSKGQCPGIVLLAEMPSYSSSDQQCQGSLNLPIAGTAMSCSQEFAVFDGFSKMPDAVTAKSCFHRALSSMDILTCLVRQQRSLAFTEVPASTHVRTAEVKAGLPHCCRHHAAQQHRPKRRRDGFGNSRGVCPIY